MLVSMQYNPPAGQLGEWVASMFGNNPRKTIAEDLQRFKELMETGNVMTQGIQESRDRLHRRMPGIAVPRVRCGSAMRSPPLPKNPSRRAIRLPGPQKLCRRKKGAGYHPAPS